ncbi:hypothetical protein HBI50_104970 [Parastagonospora nodorum]|nr:hypothetical protein HBI50_104970 [Parastagonospora nodorum]
MLQTNVREGYRIITLEVIELIEDLISYLAVAKYTQLRNAQIPKVFYEAAYSAKVKTEDLSNTLTLILSKTAQQQSSSVVSNRSTASITNKFSVALLTKPAILNNANVALVDAVHHSIQKLEENYFKVRAQHLKYDVIDALTIMLIKDDDDLLGTVNSHIKSRRLRAVMLLCQTTKLLGDSNKDGPPLKRYKTEAADSRHAKASRGRTKKDKDLEDSNTSSDVPRLCRKDRAAARAQLAKRKQLGKEAQLKKTRDEEELAKAKKEKEEKEAQERKTYLDINPKDDSEDEEATTAKDLSLCKSRDSNRTLHSRRTEVQNAQAEGNAIEYNAVNDNNKLCLTKGERTFYCACKRSPSFNAEPRQAATIMTTLQFCFFSDSSPENIGRLTKEEAIEMQIDTTNAISKALAAANKLVALQSYVLEGVDYQETFVIVCSFRKVDKHMFRAYNTISVTAQRTIIRKGSSYIEKRAILLPSYITAIASYPALTTLKAAQFKTYGSRKVKRFILNSVKDLFTNLSKDYFLVREARAITKSSLKFQNLSNLCSESIAAEDAAKAANILPPLKEVRAKILIESYKLIKFSNKSVLVMQGGITQHEINLKLIIVALIAFAEAIILTEATHVVIIELQDSIVYFNLDSELELKVLGKQDVKTTS